MSRAAERRAEAARAQQITETLVQSREDFVVDVYKLDRRCKDGERIHQVIRLDNETQEWVDWYVSMLAKCLSADEYRISVRKSWTTVKSLMTNKEVVIRSEDRGGVCDPSQERFWSM